MQLYGMEFFGIWPSIGSQNHSAAMETGTQYKGYGISAAHDQNTENSSHEEGGTYNVQCHTKIDLQTACFLTHITLLSLVNTPDSPAL